MNSENYLRIVHECVFISFLLLWWGTQDNGTERKKRNACPGFCLTGFEPRLCGPIPLSLWWLGMSHHRHVAQEAAHLRVTDEKRMHPMSSSGVYPQCPKIHPPPKELLPLGAEGGSTASLAPDSFQLLCCLYPTAKQIYSFSFIIFPVSILIFLYLSQVNFSCLSCVQKFC